MVFNLLPCFYLASLYYDCYIIFLFPSLLLIDRDHGTASSAGVNSALHSNPVLPLYLQQRSRANKAERHTQEAQRKQASLCHWLGLWFHNKHSFHTVLLTLQFKHTQTHMHTHTHTHTLTHSIYTNELTNYLNTHTHTLLHVFLWSLTFKQIELWPLHCLWYWVHITDF